MKKAFLVLVIIAIAMTGIVSANVSTLPAVEPTLSPTPTPTQPRSPPPLPWVLRRDITRSVQTLPGEVSY